MKVSDGVFELISNSPTTTPQELWTFDVRGVYHQKGVMVEHRTQVL